MDDTTRRPETLFWDRVAVKFTDKTFKTVLISDHYDFEGLDQKPVVMHAASKLQQIWKELNREYVKINIKFTKSGKSACLSSDIRYVYTSLK